MKNISSLVSISALFFSIPAFVLAGPLDTATPIAVGLTRILDFLLSIVGIVGIMGLVVAGSMYFFAAGDMRQIAMAKKITYACVTGILIALGSLVLVRAITQFFP